MARKDVDLVIRAKDEAAKVVDSITNALNEFVAAQASLETRAQKTESSLGQLGAALGSLDRAVKGLDVGAKITGEMDRAASAVARLEGEVAATTAEVAKLGQEFGRSQAVTDHYTAKMNGAAAALERQRSAVAQAKTDQKELTAAYEQAAAAQAKIARRQAELPAIIARQSEALQKASARYSELSLKIEGVDKPSRSLVASFEASGRAVAVQREKLSALQSELQSLDGKLRVAGSAAAIFAQQSADAAVSLAKQQGALDKIAKNYADLGVKSKAAVQQQRGLDEALDKATESLQRQQAVLNRAEGEYVDLAVAAGKADEALSKLSAQSVGNLQGELDRQRRAMLEAKREYVGLTAAATKLATEIGRVGVPTREMSQAFAQTKANAAAAKEQYESQRVTLELLGRAFRAAGTDIASIQGAQAKFVELLTRQAAVSAQAQAALKAQAASIAEVHATSERAARSARGLASGTRDYADSARSGAQGTSQLADAYRRLVGDTRQSLSLTQRLRGEVLSLIAAYGGFYGVINLLGQVVGAYQTLEAAQARLNVTNDGDMAKTAEDMDFLRRTADRLGVDLGTLSTEYSKFAIATKGTNLEGAATRKIFTSVAEAARVNRTSTAELSGVFVALTQIVSKGAVQMEELRQQLGDRLPGALQIMADGLGVGTDELIKMMEQGQVTSEALIPFAEELDRRFGPGLGEALAGTTVALGRLKNAAFQALVEFGNGGFIDAFTNLANDLTELLQSADFTAFLQNLSAGFAVLIDVLALAAQNFQLVAVAISAMIGLKIAPLIVGLIADFTKLTAAIGLTRTAAAAASGAMAATGAAAAGAAGGVGLLGRALALVRANPIGLILTAGLSVLTYMATEADAASEALSAHQKIVDAVKNAYDETGNSVEAWRKKVENLTLTDAKRNLDDLIDAMESARGRLGKAYYEDGEPLFSRLIGFGAFTGASQDFNAEIDKIRDKFREGGMSAKELLAAVDKTSQKFIDGSAANKRYAEALIDAIKPMVALEEAIAEAKNVITAMEGDTASASEALGELSGATKETAATFEERANKAVTTFNESMVGLRDLMPGMTAEMRKFNEEVSKIEAAFSTALAAARAMPDAIMRIAAEQEALKLRNDALLATGNAYADSVASGSLVDRIIGVESGGNASAKNPDSTATGLGQFIESTWLRMFKQYFPDRAAGMTNAMILALREDASISRSMVDLYLKENARFLQQAGLAVTDANLYLAHFLGPGGAKALIGSAPGTTANAVLGSDQISANASILDGKTREEVIAWAQRKVGISQEELSIQEQIQENERRAADEAAKAAEEEAKRAADARQDTKDRLADGQFEIDQQNLILQGKERQAAIEEAIREARAENPAISQAEIDAIAEQAGRLFDLEKQQENATTAKERAQKAEEEVNNLLAQRQALMAQLEMAQKSGDTELQSKLKTEITGINEQLVSAIENAKNLWGAVGGSEADAAIAKLTTATMEAKNFSTQAQQNYLDWTRVTDLLVNGLSSAFDRFSQAVAEGKSVGEAAREAFLQFAADFLRQIAQMIIQQAIFNALKGAFGGTPFGATIGLGHTGGIVGSTRVGSGNMSRKVNPAVFSGAMRYHTGGIVGLAPNEVPIIAKKGEAMLTEDDPFHPANRNKLGLGAKAAEVKTKIVNAIDGASFLAAALASEEGERVILNWLSANADAVAATRG